MALLVVMLAIGLLPLGRYGWHVLGAATVLGTGLVWWGTERIWGTFSKQTRFSASTRATPGCWDCEVDDALSIAGEVDV